MKKQLSNGFISVLILFIVLIILILVNQGAMRKAHNPHDNLFEIVLGIGGFILLVLAIVIQRMTKKN